MSYPFYILDVFAEEKYAGNQLAVIRNAAGISDAEMLKITRETKFSEATFIMSDEPRNGGCDTRIFGPAGELPFAGHPTLGTAYIVQREIICKRVEKVILNLKVGQIPVTFTYRDAEADILTMRQNPPTFGYTYDRAEVMSALSLRNDDADARFPVQDVSTGNPAVIVPLKSLDAVKRAKVKRGEYFALFRGRESSSLLVFSAETYKKENQLNVRVFAEHHNIPEDPATGSGNGCLAGYLAKYRYFGSNNVEVRVEQGYEIGRPSLLFLKSEDRDGKIEVNVGGKAILLVKGELL